MSPAELLEIAREAAEAAATLLLDALETTRTVESKSSATDVVTEMDRAAETLIVGRLRAHRPGDSLIAEEGAIVEGTTGVRWLIDPLDGTTNYLYRHPGWSVSIGAEIDGVPAVGVVVDPVHNEVFTAALGLGAHRNGRIIAPSSVRDLRTALVATGFSYDADQRGRQAAVLVDVLPNVRDIRRVGSAALDLCSVACGRVDAYYELGLAPWDLAAGLVIATESGARTGAIDGGPVRPGSVIAAAPALFDPLMRLLNGNA